METICFITSASPRIGLAKISTSLRHHKQGQTKDPGQEIIRLSVQSTSAAAPSPDKAERSLVFPKSRCPEKIFLDPAQPSLPVRGRVGKRFRCASGTVFSDTTGEDQRCSPSREAISESCKALLGLKYEGPRADKNVQYTDNRSLPHKCSLSQAPANLDKPILNERTVMHNFNRHRQYPIMTWPALGSKSVPRQYLASSAGQNPDWRGCSWKNI